MKNSITSCFLVPLRPPKDRRGPVYGTLPSSCPAGGVDNSRSWLPGVRRSGRMWGKRFVRLLKLKQPLHKFAFTWLAPPSPPTAALFQLFQDQTSTFIPLFPSVKRAQEPRRRPARLTSSVYVYSVCMCVLCPTEQYLASKYWQGDLGTFFYSVHLSIQVPTLCKIRLTVNCRAALLMLAP